jgi:protein O-mannosyl-transferase
MMRDLLICLALAAITAAVYSPVSRHQFVNYDDDGYVYANPHVTTGLNWDNIKWAFQTHALANYHPLTWLSYELDVSLFGVRPQPMHIENLLIHALNTALLYLLLRRATGDIRPAILAAAIFGLHPLHVESVAWISERKDLLSTMFFLLATGAYLQYVSQKRHKWIPYAAVVLLFALGLASKPMIVTFPLVLMLLDYWPLRRKFAIAEKIPLLIMSAIWCWITVKAQAGGGVMIDLQKLPLSDRLANVAVSYARYLGKTIWPTGLSVFYPHPLSWPIAEVAATTALIAAITAICLWTARRRPYLIVGWLIFLGMLVPVIGLVQVGYQSIADRYMYLPMIGLAVMAAWSLPKPATIIAPIILIAFATITIYQLQYWQDTRTLFDHALAVTDNNVVAHVQLGLLTHDAAAARHYEEAIRIDPTFYAAEYNLANLLLSDDPQQAILHYRRAAQDSPSDARVQNNLGIAVAKTGNLTEAAEHFRSAAALLPDYPDPHANLGLLLIQQGDRIAAAAEFQAALHIDPNFPLAQRGLASLSPVPSP